MERPLPGCEDVGRVGVQGEVVRAVVHQDAGVAGHEARPEPVVEALDQRARVPVRVDGADVDRVAADGRGRGRRGRGRVREQLVRGEAHVVGVGHVGVAQGEGVELRGDEVVEVGDGPRRRAPVHPAQHQERGDALAVGRGREHVEIAVADRDRRGPVRAVPAQILRGQEAAGRLTAPPSRWASSPA